MFSDRIAVMAAEIGSIAGIFISPAPQGLEKPARGGFDMIALKSGVLVAGKGICSTDGLLDRYFGPDGVKSRGAYPPDKVRQLSIVTWDAIERANNVSEIPFTWAETRRNIILYGVSAEELNDLSEKTFKLGEVELRGTGLCDPCDRPSTLSKKKGFKAAFKPDGVSIAGIRVEILNTGSIQIGEKLVG